MKRRRQRGVVLILLLFVLSLGGLWYVVSQLQARSADFVARNRMHNAKMLAAAKQALLGYVAQRAAVSGENNPGAFPCPEAAGNVGGPDEGIASGNCSLPAVGRLPWKTLGSDKFLDAAGEPLWYVVANGWAKPNPLTTTVINSNCTDAASAMTCFSGQLTVDGQANGAVAMIIAPGQAMNVQASAGCNARAQSRQAPAPTINALDYLECYNTATSSFVTAAASTSYNDQAVRITAAEVLPLIEGAIADRFQREFGAQMKTAYSGGLWPATPVLPFAVALDGSVTTSPRTKLQGASGTTGGLLPGSHAFAGPCTCDVVAGSELPAPCLCTVNSQGQRSAEPCNPADPVSGARCDAAFVAWRPSGACGAAFCTTLTRTAGAALHSYSCSVSGTPSTLSCDVNGSALLFDPGMTINLNAVARNVGMTFRTVTSPSATSKAPQISGIDTTSNSPFGYTITSATLNNDGSATVRINARFAAGSGSLLAVLSGLTCGLLGLLCFKYTIAVPMAILADHALVDPSNDAYNWFYRNRWQEVAYYALAPGIAPSGARSCTTSSTCLQVNYNADAGKHRALLVIGGQKLATIDASGNPYTQVRPASLARDLLDDINAAGASPFEWRSPTLAINRAFNDHFAVIDKNP